MTPVVLTVMLLVAGTLLVLGLFLRGLRLVGRKNHLAPGVLMDRVEVLLMEAARNEAFSKEISGLTLDVVLLRGWADTKERERLTRRPFPHRSTNGAVDPSPNVDHVVDDWQQGRDKVQPQ